MKRALCAAILCLEAVVLGLTTPVLISVQDVSTGKALWVGLGLMVLCVLTAGMLRRTWAYWLGWAIQLAALALGFEISVMFVLGLIFLVLWLTAFLLGERIEVDRSRAEVAAAVRDATPVPPPPYWDHEMVCDADTYRPFVRRALADLRTPRNMALLALAVLIGVALLFSSTARPAGVLLIGCAVAFPLVSWLAQRQAWRSFLAPGRTFRTAFGSEALTVQADDNLAGIAYADVTGAARRPGLVSLTLAGGGRLELPEAVFPQPWVSRLSGGGLGSAP